MAWRYGYYCEPRYVCYPDMRLDRCVREYQELAPVTFREPPFYDYVYYWPDCVRGHPHPGHGHLVYPCNWCGYFPHCEHPVAIVGHQHPPYSVQSTVEMYAPQLYSDCCERLVRKSFDDMPGVEEVVVDRCQKKVVVQGYNLRPEIVLRRLQRVRNMDRSTFWHYR